MSNLNLKTKTRYGMAWPVQVPDHQVELYLAKKWREPEYRNADFLNPVHEHMLRALRMLFTPAQLSIHPWFETMAHSWVNDTFATWWGAASCGKSHAMGVLALVDYLTDPTQTYTLLASTTKDMLELRSFASVVEYLSHLKANKKMYVPFKYIRARMVIAPEYAEENDLSNLKAIIKGVAVQQGTEAEASAALIGVHLDYVRQVGDELEAMRPAFSRARMNLSQVGKDFKFIASCNPESLVGEAGKLSVPAAGWASIDPETSDEWVSQLGKVYRFNALKSPGIKEPLKYPFLPTQKKIDDLLKQNHNNWDAPAIWTYLKAFPPPNATERTVITETELVSHSMCLPPVWRDSYKTIAAIDPAFTSDGDNAIFQTAHVGYSSTGILTLSYADTFYLTIKASSKVPVLEQLVGQSCELLKQLSIPIEYLGVDDSGTQSVADAIEMRHGVGLCRFNFGAKPPQLPVSTVNFTLASDKYRNVATWLHYTLAEYARFGQIRNLPDKAARQLCLRRLLPKQQPLQVESKGMMKKRISGASPDEADACVLVAGLARMRLGMPPGATEYSDSPVIVGYASTADFSQAAMKFNNMNTCY